uniref:Uncharacterized protein n=1 Tax=Setaria italica TaxID=4555 RepID=K3Y410_SETIT
MTSSAFARPRRLGRRGRSERPAPGWPGICRVFGLTWRVLLVEGSGGVGGRWNLQ